MYIIEWRRGEYVVAFEFPIRPFCVLFLKEVKILFGTLEGKSPQGFSDA